MNLAMSVRSITLVNLASHNLFKRTYTKYYIAWSAQVFRTHSFTGLSSPHLKTYADNSKRVFQRFVESY